MGNRRIGYYKSFKAAPESPIIVVPECMFEDYDGLTKPQVSFMVKFGGSEEAVWLDVDETTKLRDALTSALDDRDAVVERTRTETRRHMARRAERVAKAKREVAILNGELTESV